ncbi:protein SFI1 homolog [Solea solea]|uniref:protein SFI1 homolog n=1 Tax=Solea solea TaxID=90069 RepID=UPI00272D0029|nr:protein SFI1 homolog [Solea solea]
MPSNSRKPGTGKVLSASLGSSGQTKLVRKVQTRKFVYRVGYSWNKGGRLKELRIRHLARKFLHIWMHNTFGRVPPHVAKSHYDSVVLRRAFEGWTDEWWTSRREWSLKTRAECHYRYYLYNWVFHSWRTFMSLQQEKKSKLKTAQSYADRQQMQLVWDRWEVFTEMRRMKKRMLESAFEQNKLSTLRSAWSLWQTRLQQHQHLHTLEAQCLKQRELTLQRTALHRWKEFHTALCCHKDKETKASLHVILRLKRKTLHQWVRYVSCCQTKRKTQAAAQHACNLRLVRMCWSNWSKALHRRLTEEDRLQATAQLATRSTQRRALQRWRDYVTLCRDEAEENQMANQHHLHHLLSAGMQGLHLNVTWNKTQRLNNNMALQQYYQTMMRTFWRLWQDHLEEAEDESFQPLLETAQSNYSVSLLTSCFHLWREKLAEQRHMQELERRADVWFAEHMLPQCFSSWVKFTLQRRLYKQRRKQADVFNKRRRCTWVISTWWGRAEKHKEQILSEQMAVLHEERYLVQRALARWRQRTEQRINEKEKLEASDCLYLHRLLHNTVTQWKDNSFEIRDRRDRECQAFHQGDLCCVRWALGKWKKFVQNQRVKKGKLEEIQLYHETKLLKHTCEAWKKHHLQMSRVCSRVEELHSLKMQHFLRMVLSVWRENAALQAEYRLMEQRAQNHFQHVLRSKVLHAWQEATTHAVSKRHQEAEAVSIVQRSVNQVFLLRTFRQWRMQTRDARRERMSMERARRHYNSKLLWKALREWNNYHDHCRKYKVMKRQGIMLLRLKMYQSYFEQWKIKLQHRRREVKQTEQALWHWSLTLQAKVLYGWRLWVTEQRRKQEQAATAALVYRDQLLREGVTCILTYAAHMNDLTSSLTQHSQEQVGARHKALYNFTSGGTRHLQGVVRRCAMRWKQRALCKPQREQAVHEQPAKKSVTFCLTTRGPENVSSVEQEVGGGVLSELPPTRACRRQPRRCEELFESPGTGTQYQTGIISTEAAPKPFLMTSTHQSTITSSVSPSEPPVSVVDLSLGTQSKYFLLPPSAFMNPSSQNMPQNSRCPELLGGGGTDPVSAMTSELLSIQLDMKSFQQDRKQLRAWQKLREVLHSWLQTSAEDDEQMEKDCVHQELKELEERITRLSLKLAERKPTMLHHTQRIQHLQNILHTAGVSSLR